MNVGSALIAGPAPRPQMIVEAVRQALTRAGLERANGLVLMLSREFGRLAGQAVLAAARTAGCLQVTGATADGVFTEAGWALDQPAVAALALGGNLALAPVGDGPKLCFADGAASTDWFQFPRIGLLHGGQSWNHARLATDGRSECAVVGASATCAVSSGLKSLGEINTVTAVRGFDVLRLGEQSVVDNLLRALPADLRMRTRLPIHLLAALPEGRTDIPAIPLLSANADGSVTFGQPLAEGDTFAWGARQPLTAENDMREVLADAALRLSSTPDFGIQFSCIGRGPLFYNGDDRDLAAWRTQFPDVPLIGAYGSGQLAPAGESSRQWQNAVVSALYCRNHV
ncbi:MAG: FIST C-terminal domain-containing protein [Betaproteobacteria bacterium]